MFEGRENAIAAQHLLNGETCILTGYGQSMAAGRIPQWPQHDLHRVEMWQTGNGD